MSEPPDIHHRDTRGHAKRLFLVVRDDQKRRPDTLLDADQLTSRLFAQFTIECGERLIEQQKLRHLGQRARQGHALPLPARQLMRPAVRVIRHLNERQHLLNATRAAAAFHALLTKPERDIGGDIHVRKQSVGLEHHVDRAPVGRQPGHIEAIDDDMPAIRGLKARDHAQQGCLAAARRPEQYKKLAPLDAQTDVVNRGRPVEMLTDPVNFEQRHDWVINPFGHSSAARGAFCQIGFATAGSADARRGARYCLYRSCRRWQAPAGSRPPGFLAQEGGPDALASARIQSSTA